MEAFLIALLALGKTYRSQAVFVPEPDKFQPFDHRALRQANRAMNVSASITEPYPAQQQASNLVRSTRLPSLSIRKYFGEVSVSPKKANRKSPHMTHEPSIPAILCFDLAFLLGYVYWALWQLEKNDQDE
jgi:hypothetical protein